MVGLIANIGKSFGYSARNTFLHPLFWLGLIITVIIAGLCIFGSIVFLGMGMWYLSVILWIITAIIGLFFLGLEVKIFGDKKLTFAGFFGTVGRGFQALIISIIYGFIIAVVYAICNAIGVFGTSQQSIDALMAQIQAGTINVNSLADIGTTLFPNGATAGGVIMLIVFILVTLFLSMLYLSAMVNFATAGKFGAAFHFGEIFRRIGWLGILKFIVGMIIFAIIIAVIAFVIGFLAGLLGMIPVVGWILVIIFAALVGPFFYVFGVKYLANIFAD